MRIYILGHRCRLCDLVEELIWDVVEEKEVAATIKRITQDKNIIKFGVSLVPAIVIENKIKVMGRKPRREEVLFWILEEMNENEKLKKIETVIQLSGWFYP